MLETIKTLKKGTFAYIVTQKEVTNKDGQTVTISRTGSIQVGVNWQNKQATITGKNSGAIRQNTGSLPFGDWVNFGEILEYKGVKYFRAYVHENSRTTYKYALNGAEVTLEEANLYAKDRPKVRAKFSTICTFPLSTIKEIRPN